MQVEHKSKEGDIKSESSRHFRFQSVEERNDARLVPNVLVSSNSLNRIIIIIISMLTEKMNSCFDLHTYIHILTL